MGFFAVVRELDQPFVVKVCHLNLWSLAGLFRRAFFWDVGLQLKAGSDKELLSFSLALPFTTRKKGMKDLSESLKNHEIAELVFGTSVSISGSCISYEKPEGSVSLELGCVSLADSALVDGRSGATYSFWKICLAEPIPPGQERYIRLRFEVYNLGRTWIWKSFKSGTIIDLRVADIRETVSVKDWNDINGRIVGIDDLYLFVIAPSWLQHSSSSPQLKYMRLLEGRVWEGYLRRKTDFWRVEKMVIYYWRKVTASPEVVNDAVSPQTEDAHVRQVPHTPNAAVSAISPFRAFLDLDKNYVSTAAGMAALTTAAVFVAALLADAYVIQPAGFAASLTELKKYVKDHADLFSVVGGIALLKLVNEKYRLVTKVYPKLVKYAYDLEQWLYMVRQEP